MTLLLPHPRPATKLGYYRILSPSAGVRVSPLALGAGSIGKEWHKIGMGTMNKESSLKLLDAFYEAGGNFIDTANNYQDETSESIIGEWMESRGNREQMVIGSKYSAFYKRADTSLPIRINYAGNHSKSLYVSVEASLKKLRTDYIDILYIHCELFPSEKFSSLLDPPSGWTWDTSVEEVMNALHHLVAARKVLYLGISDTSAWIVSKANQYARLTGKTPFSIYQGQWSILERSFERDIIPMARSEGLALAPWGVMGAGRIRTDEEERRRKESGERGRTEITDSWERTEDEKKVCKKLEEVAAEVGAKSITAVAIAYVLHKTPYVFPIVGGRKVEHLHANLEALDEALDITLTPEHIEKLEGVLPFDVGFQSKIIGNGLRMIRPAGWTQEWQAMPALPSSE